MKKLFTLLLLTVSISLFSQPVRWNFPSPGTTAVTVKPSGITASDATFGTGLDSIVFAKDNNQYNKSAYRAQYWTTGNSIDPNDYIKVCITNTSGESFDIKKFEFFEKRNVDGPRKWDLKYSIDGGTEQDVSINNSISGNSWHPHSRNLNLTLSNNQQICFKIYGYDADQENLGRWKFNDIVISGTGAIPIKLLDFTAKRVDYNALIEWSTLSEKNSDYFSVEWSKDGVNFEEIAKMDAAGTSRDKREYRYIHKNPKMGVNYYRLTQYDFDGRSETFYVVSVDFDSKTLDMFIVPNRVENSLRLEFTQSVEDARLHIYNMEGQVVKSYILASGIDAFNFDVSALSSGQYIAKYVDARKTISKRFVKL